MILPPVAVFLRGRYQLRLFTFRSQRLELFVGLVVKFGNESADLVEGKISQCAKDQVCFFEGEVELYVFHIDLNLLFTIDDVLGSPP